MLSQDFLKTLRTVVEGKAYVLNLSCFFKLTQISESVYLLCVFIHILVQCVKPVIVYVVDSEALYRLVEYLLHTCSVGSAEKRKLCGYCVGVMGISFNNCFPEGNLALAAVVNISGVKIGEALRHKYVYHFLDLFNVNIRVVASDNRKAHKSEA